MEYLVSFKFHGALSDYDQIVSTESGLDKAQEIAIKQMNDDLDEYHLPWLATYGNIIGCKEIVF